jgi:uncharacterized membrane protein YebE (DUF533 family)
MSAMNVDIGRDTVLALCAIAWADGSVDQSEAAGIRAAVRQLGLGAADSQAVEQALANHMSIADVETIRMNRLTRLFTYSAAVWIAAVDGGIKPDEERDLSILGDRLGLSSVAREQAKNVALGALSASGGQELDLLKMRSRLSAGLSQIGLE